MALPATDNFNRTNGAVGANWTAVDGGANVASNEAIGTGGETNLLFWASDTFGNDQYAQAKAGGTVGASGAGATTRVASLRGYLLSMEATNSKLYLMTGNESFSLLKTFTGVAFATGNLGRLESQGTTHVCLKNGSSMGTSTTDGTYGSGSAGFWAYGTGFTLDDWEGGNLGTTGRLLLRLQADGLFAGASL